MDYRAEQPRAGPRRAYRRRHARAACATISSAARSTCPAAQGRRARRSRRDARPRLPRGSRIHPRRHAGRTPHADVLGHRAERDRHAGPHLPDAMRCASHAQAAAEPARRHRIPRHARGARATASTRSSTSCASTKPQTALVFCKTRANVNHLLARMGNRGFPVVALSGELSQQRTHPRAAGPARWPRPRLRRHRRRRPRHRPAGSRTGDPRRSARPTPKRCCTARAAPAAPAARASRR